VLALVVAALSVLAMGCGSATAIDLRSWTVTSRAHAQALVSLPAHLDGWLDGRPDTLVLRTTATIPRDWQGQPLTLAIPFLQAPVSLDVDGAPAAPLDDEVVPGVHSFGSHSFRVETARAEVELTLRVDAGSFRAAWLDAPPSLSATPHGDTRFAIARALNGPISIGTYAVLSMIGFQYFVLYFFDRRRQVHLWFALQALGAAYLTIEHLGIPQTLGLPPLFASFTLPLGAIASVYFSHAYFQLPRPHVAFRAGVVAAAVAAVIGSHGFSSPQWTRAALLGALVVEPYQLVLLVRMYRAGRDRFAAAMLIVPWLVLALTSPVDAVWATGLGELAGGVHTLVLGLGFYGVAQAIVLGRDHVRSLRDADALNQELRARVAMLEDKDGENRRLENELRRQIADRSERLAAALAKIGTVTPRVARLAPGEEVHGRYRVLRELGEGGMGAVYEVERKADGRRLALKVLTSASTGVALARLAREAQVAATVDHENVVAIADVDVDASGAVYLVMELVEGAPLDELRDHYGSVLWARPILGQLAAGLAALHARGIVHRDLKPANVLLTRAGVVKIADFGIARLGAEGDTPDPQADTVPADAEPTVAAMPNLALTRTGVLMGTPQYMAPELARGARSAGASSDLWSFGIIAYELSTGKAPYATPPVLDALAGRAVARVGFAGAGFAASERAVLEGCLDVDAAARPAAAEVARVFSGE
jgi:serine/threonine-protein kinase